ncbi:hypothetical protein GRF29_77g221150 [Pseudopithomyces chartarum]|uniref:Uncharacterized protein n=1 Tax=Pseudopithomyces chartarum TaxID=1892770 RepID=A0AAN6LVL2_9PLEO|nr:hypothetical protein GRF29_77g221150 [Pseudopithomyces chartarum]
MYAKASLAVLLGLAAASTAQTTSSAGNSTAAKPSGPVITLVMPGADNLPGDQKMPLVGSIIAVEGSQTTLAVKCVPGTDETICGMPDDGMTVTKGPEKQAMNTLYPAWDEEDKDAEYKGVMVDYGWECSLGGNTTAECTYHATGSVTNSADATALSAFNADITEQGEATILKLNGTALRDAQFPVTITAGTEKEKAEASKTGSEAGKETGAEGAAVSVKVGGYGIAGAMAALFLL